MRVTVCYSTGRVETTILREWTDDRRRLIVSCPWHQPARETVAKIADQLTAEELREVRAAFGLDQPGGAA